MSAENIENEDTGQALHGAFNLDHLDNQPKPALLSNQRDKTQAETPKTELNVVMPPGLQALCEACLRVYPTQPNPLQVSTRLKYWLGGKDPLDYISMYWNEGNADMRVSPHWHYISFGMSDLHGDGRVHAIDKPESGFGIEMTMRLKADTKEAPPIWPAVLMHSLARYVFATGNKLCAGDHVSWHDPLNGGQSRLRHLLVTADPQFPTIHTPYGTVTFLQLVGCTNRELRVAQRESVADVLHVMREHKLGGGDWLVSDIGRRSSCVRSVRSSTAAAHLGGVAARLHWTSDANTVLERGKSLDSLSRSNMDLEFGTHNQREQSDMSTDSFKMSSIDRALSEIGEQWLNSGEPVNYVASVHIYMNAESAALIPLAINGRVLHQRHFTWHHYLNNGGVTVVGEGVTGAAVSATRRFAHSGPWLQVYLTKEMAQRIASESWESQNATDSESDSDSDTSAPKSKEQYFTRVYQDYGLGITVVPDVYFL